MASSVNSIRVASAALDTRELETWRLAGHHSSTRSLHWHKAHPAVTAAFSEATLRGSSRAGWPWAGSAHCK